MTKRAPARSARGKNSADFEKTSIALIAASRPVATLGSATKLLVADHCQYRPQAFVVSDRALIHVADFVEGAVGEVSTAVADRKPAIGVIENGHVFAGRGLGRLTWLHDEDHFVVLQRQGL